MISNIAVKVFFHHHRELPPVGLDLVVFDSKILNAEPS